MGRGRLRGRNARPARVKRAQHRLWVAEVGGIVQPEWQKKPGLDEPRQILRSTSSTWTSLTCCLALEAVAVMPQLAPLWGEPSGSRDMWR